MSHDAGPRPIGERTLTKEIKSFPFGNINLIDAPGFDGQKGIWEAEQIEQFLGGKFTEGSFIENANGNNSYWVIKEDGKPIKPDGIIILLDENDLRADVLKSFTELLKQLNGRTGTDKIPFVLGLTHLQEDAEREKKINENFKALKFEAPQYVLLPWKTNDESNFGHDVYIQYLTLLEALLIQIDAFKGPGPCPPVKRTFYRMIELISEYTTLFYNRANESELIQPLILQMESIPSWALIIITLLVVLILQKLCTRPPPRIQNPPDGENQI